MILVFNALAWGFEHVPFDAALIASIAQAFPGEPIHFLGERDHVAHVKRFLEPRGAGVPTDVSWREIELPQRVAPPGERAPRDLAICRAMLAEGKQLGASRVVACYLHSLTGIAALKALSYLHRGAPLAFIHHGSLLKLLSSRRFHPLLALGNARVRQIVLADSIRDELTARLPSMRGKVSAIRHPYFFDEAPTPSELPPSGPMTFSFLGMVDDSKGFPAFLELAAAVAPSRGDAARFDLIGGKRVDATPDCGPWVTTYPQKGFMPRDVFEAKLRASTYPLFPFNPAHYNLVASGSVLDALTAGKPFIGLRNSQFDEMFRTMGDIGYLCDSVAEMRSLIESVVRDPPRERYLQQSRNILAGRRIFEPPAVAAQLREILAA